MEPYRCSRRNSRRRIFGLYSLSLQNAQDKEKIEKQLVAILKYMGFNNNYIHRKMVQKEIKEIASKIYGFTSG